MNPAVSRKAAAEAPASGLSGTGDDGISLESRLKKQTPSVSLELEDGRRFTCGLVGIARGEIQLISEESVPELCSVAVRFDRISIAGSVMYCRSKGDCYRVSIQIDGHERSEPRFPLSNPCTATVLAREYQRVSGHLTDFSGSGLGLVVSAPCPGGSMMVVETDKLLIVGEVRYCLENSESEYRVGLANTEIHLDSSTTQRHHWKNRLHHRVTGLMRFDR